jgi:hypothetical protein
MTTFAKTYAIKVRDYGEYVGEHIGNLKYWEPNKNPLRTWRELSENAFGNQGKMKKYPPPPHPPSKKKKKQSTLGACLGLPIGCMKFLFPKEFITIFDPSSYYLQRTPYFIINLGAFILFHIN